MKRNVATNIALAALALLGPALFAAPGCESEEAGKCGAGTVEAADGSCTPETATCGQGTHLEGATCVKDDEADTTESDVEQVDVPIVTDPDAVGFQPDAECVPNCDGRACGSDGCGGSCGTCSAGACNTAGACVAAGWTCDADRFGDHQVCDCECGAADPDCASPGLLVLGCESGEICSATGVCATCAPRCDGVSCGDDGCGGSCGRCLDPANPYCTDGACVAACVPDCDGHDCGPDGCGGECGVCGVGTYCVLDKCLALDPALSCDGRCGDTAPGGCSCKDGCGGGRCCGDFASACDCIPRCDGKTCGPDGCGGSCGTCAVGADCVDGNCVDDPCDPNPCLHGTCGAGGACACDLGYAGDTCGECATGYVDFPACTYDACQNVDCRVGSCNQTTGRCDCPPGVGGAFCDACLDPTRAYPGCTEPLDPCSANRCNDHGVCGPTGACVCRAGFTGPACDTCASSGHTYPSCSGPADPCAGVDCGAHGVCAPAFGVCSCDTGFTGDACELCARPGDAFPACHPCLDDGECGAGGGECTAGTCGPDNVCRVLPVADGTPCFEGTCVGGACGFCGSDGDCDDHDGCTVDHCERETGSCFYDRCDTALVGWNFHVDVPATATAASPYTFGIDGWDGEVSFSRTGNGSLIQGSYPPIDDGSFDTALGDGTTVAWRGAVPFLDVLPGSETELVTGSVTFAFSAPASARGPRWHVVLAVGGTGGAAGEGPTTITCDQPLQPYGAVDVFGNGHYVRFQAPSTLVGSGDGVDNISFFLLPSAATRLSCTITTAGSVPDPHGYAVGMVDLAASVCQGAGDDATCVGPRCGDGIQDAAEGCDDGGTLAGDGCSAACQVEGGGTCETPVVTSTCEGAPCGAFGGSCCAGGTCDLAALSCNAANHCQCPPDKGVLCGNVCCDAGDLCQAGSCVTPAPTCLTFATTARGTCTSGSCPASCKAQLQANPASLSGVYMIQPTPAQPPFPARCDMALDGGGWTLVGYEAAGAPGTGSFALQTGALASLWLESGTAQSLADGSATGFIGPRLSFSRGDYTHLRLNWCDPGVGSNFYQSFKTSEEIFADAQRAANGTIVLSEFQSNDALLNQQVATPDSARFCRARTSTIRPGDTSWGVKGANEANFDCGCNSGGWAGVGSYYGGAENCTLCDCYGGGWSGTAGNGVQKGGINKHTFYLWVR
ncbi:MAG: hypothetical protein H6745_30215 [Deltaproteobacteria bacterium]|nr:hypothetical protein [Deltaproteobacteria bacterium]